MGFAVDRKHRDVYQKQRWIELTELMTKSQPAAILNDALHVVGERAHLTKISQAAFPAETRFLYGHDLWRAIPSIKRVVLDKKLAEAASSIIEFKPLRIAYDQLYSVPAEGKIGIGVYSTLLSSTPTLQELSSVQGVVCGLFLCIEAKEQTDEPYEPGFFPSTEGSGVLFAPDFRVPFHELAKRKGCTYLLIVYTQSKSVYIHQDSDPHLNEFKKLGYSFNDKLSDTLNPLVYH